MSGEGNELYMGMRNVGWKSSWATGFEGKLSSCDGISSVW